MGWDGMRGAGANEVEVGVGDVEFRVGVLIGNEGEGVFGTGSGGAPGREF